MLRQAPDSAFIETDLFQIILVTTYNYLITPINIKKFKYNLCLIWITVTVS